MQVCHSTCNPDNPAGSSSVLPHLVKFLHHTLLFCKLPVDAAVPLEFIVHHVRANCICCSLLGIVPARQCIMHGREQRGSLNFPVAKQLFTL